MDFRMLNSTAPFLDAFRVTAKSAINPGEAAGRTQVLPGPLPGGVSFLQGEAEVDRAHHRSAGDSCHLGVPGSAKQSANPVAGPVASLTGCGEESRFDLLVPLPWS